MRVLTLVTNPSPNLEFHTLNVFLELYHHPIWSGLITPPLIWRLLLNSTWHARCVRNKRPRDPEPEPDPEPSLFGSTTAVEYDPAMAIFSRARQTESFSWSDALK